MNKPNKRDTLNLVFSAFLVLGYIVCAYFFLTMSATVPQIAPYINAVVFIVFGLVVFYATRVGEGKAVKRFSLWTLIILDIPALYIILAQLIPALPLHTAIANLGGLMALDYSPLFMLACVALGYGIPYTFFSGYELVPEEDFCDCEEAMEEHTCDCGCCGGTQGAYVLSDEEDADALLVVDDYDLEFDKEKEIRISDVDPAKEWAKVGSYVKYVEVAASEEAEEAACDCGCEAAAEETAEAVEAETETEAAEEASEAE